MPTWHLISKRKFYIFAAITLVLGLITNFLMSRSFEPFPPDALPGVSIGSRLLSGYEASDIIWHPRLETFFLVSDQGIVSSMPIEGKTITHWLVGGDLEAVTIVSPQSDFIYLGRERSNSIYEFNIVTASVTREFDLSGWMKSPKNLGLEALTFVPDTDDPEGGLFYAGLQATGEIFIFRLPILSSATNIDVTLIGTIPPFNRVKDISSLDYVRSQDVIYAIYNSSNLLRAMATDGTVIREWDLPGKNQEGVTLKDNALFICQDNGHKGGDVIQYAPFFGIDRPPGPNTD